LLCYKHTQLPYYIHNDSSSVGCREEETWRRSWSWETQNWRREKEKSRRRGSQASGWERV